MNSIALWNWVTDRWYEFRLGDATYLRYFLNFMIFTILVYTQYVKEIRWLELLFSSILLFGLAFMGIYIPSAIIIGRFVHRKRQLRKDLMIGLTENPAAAWINRWTYEQTIRICEHLNIPIFKEYLQVYEFWKKLDNRMGYKYEES